MFASIPWPLLGLGTGPWLVGEPEILKEYTKDEGVEVDYSTIQNSLQTVRNVRDVGAPSRKSHINSRRNQRQRESGQRHELPHLTSVNQPMIAP